MHTIQETNRAAYSHSDAVNHYQKKLKLRSDENWIVENIFTKKGASILILGCGAGRTVIPFAANSEREFVITALDIAPPMVEACKKNLRTCLLAANVDVGDAAYLPADFTEKFDYVFLPFHALDYVSPLAHRYQAVIEAWRVLKPNGRLVFNTHNRFFYKYALRFSSSREKPYVRDAVPHNPGFVISYYAQPYSERYILSKLFEGKIQMIWRGKLENKFPFLKRIIRRIVPVFFEKSIYYICTKQ